MELLSIASPWLTLAVSVAGIVGTIVAWKLNPKRLLYAELDSIFKRWEGLNEIRDRALVNNDSSMLTISTSELNKLRARKTVLLSRIGANSV